MDRNRTTRGDGNGAVRARSLVGALLVLVSVGLAGCDDDDSSSHMPTPTPTPGGLGGVPGPEEVLANMAQSLASSLINKEIDALLFPSSTIDYQTLMEHFLSATQQLLDQQTITEQEGYVNGEMANLYELDVRFLATDPTDTTGINDVYNLVVADEGDVDETLGVLEQLPQQSLGGWMSGAQVKLSYLGLEIQLNAIRNPTNRAVQSALATTLDSFITYAVDTRSQVLYQNILQSVHRISDCVTGNPCENADDCSASYTDCAGHSHQYLYSSYDNPKAACDSDRIANIESCGTNTYNSVVGQLAWMDTVLSSWRDSLAGMATEVATVDQPCAVCDDVESTIVVDQLTYATDSSGSVSSQPRDGTSWLAAACDGRYTCDYTLARDDFDFSGNFALFDALYHCSDDPTPRTVMLNGAGNPLLAEGASVHLDCAPRITEFQAAFRGQPIATSAADVDVSTNSGPGVDASKVTDGISAPTGTAYNDPNYAVVFPGTGAGHAILIDTGVVQTMGDYPNYNSIFQGAGSAKTYRCEYSVDGVTWTLWGDFVTYGASGLQTGTQDLKKLSARYVRIWLITNTSVASASELRISAADGSNALLHKPAHFLAPLVNNGVYAPEGTSWNNANYATVLSAGGVAGALTIDTGKVYNSLAHVKVQADSTDTYQVDVSTDGSIWSKWYVASPVSGGGLRTRDSGPLWPVSGRYVRVYATGGDGSYSVSEVQVFENPTVPSCDGVRVCAVSVAAQLQSLVGGAPSQQDLEDFVVTWTCANDATPNTAHAVPWSGAPSFDAAVVQASCAPHGDTCNASHPTTCSHFGDDADDAAVYANAASFPYQLCQAQHPTCASVIAGKTNYYHTDPSSPSTHNNPACTNVQAAIHDAIAEGSCPPGIGADANGSWEVWPYNVNLNGGSTTSCVTDPATGQPPMLLALGCNSLTQ